MRFYIIPTLILAACGPLSPTPAETDGDTTLSTTSSATDGATGTFPTTTVATSTTETDHLSTTANPTTTIATSTTEATGEDGTAGDGVPVCTLINCEECPNPVCEGLCKNPDTSELWCLEDMLNCPGLLGPCEVEADCPAGAPSCQNNVCLAQCVTDEECGWNSICVGNICTDVLSVPVCKFNRPQPACDPVRCCPQCDGDGLCTGCQACPTEFCQTVAGLALCWDPAVGAPFCPAPPACTEVLCGAGPCLDARGQPICAPEECEPMPCEECPAASVCGTIPGGPEVCILGGEVPCTRKSNDQ